MVGWFITNLKFFFFFLLLLVMLYVFILNANYDDHIVCLYYKIDPFLLSSVSYFNINNPIIIIQIMEKDK